MYYKIEIQENKKGVYSIFAEAENAFDAVETVRQQIKNCEVISVFKTEKPNKKSKKI